MLVAGVPCVDTTALVLVLVLVVVEIRRREAHELVRFEAVAGVWYEIAGLERDERLAEPGRGGGGAGDGGEGVGDVCCDCGGVAVC